MVESNSNRKLKVYKARIEAILEQYPELNDFASSVFDAWALSGFSRPANVSIDNLQEFFDSIDSYYYVEEFNDPELLISLIIAVTGFASNFDISKFIDSDGGYMLVSDDLPAAYPLATSDKFYNDLIDSAIADFELHAGCSITTQVNISTDIRYIFVHYTFENAINYDYLCDLALQLKEDIIDAYNQCYGV